MPRHRHHTEQAEEGGRPSSRDGKVPVAGFFDPTVRRALKCLAIERSCSQQEVLAQALRLLFNDAISRGSRMVTSLPCGLEAPQGERIERRR